LPQPADPAKQQLTDVASNSEAVQGDSIGECGDKTGTYHRQRRDAKAILSRYPDKVRVELSARKHGIRDADMLHAARNAITAVNQGDRLLLIGAAHDGTLLEIGVLDPDTDPAIIHAMRLREKLYPYLDQR
jgi:hypothetical protein